VKRNSYIIAVVLHLCGIFSGAALAEDQKDDKNADKKIVFSGFLSTVFAQTENDADAAYANGLATDELALSNYENRLGLQVKATVNPTMNVTAQLLARGGNNNYDVIADWAYADLEIFNNLNVHLGKYKIPLFLVSDYAEVGYAYPWVRPPQDVYYINPLISQSGINILYNIPFNKLNLMLQVYYGSGTHDVFVPARSIDLSQLPMSKSQTIAFDTNNSTGAALSLTSQVFTLRAGYFETEVDIDAVGIKGAEGNFSGVGFTLDWHDFIVYSEYVARDTETNKIAAFPDQNAWYATLGYRIGAFLPHVTYSEIDQGNDENVLSLQQSSAAAGLRYEINSYSDLKLEALYAEPEEGNHGLFDEPVEDAMVYSIAVDVIF
jgi:hypothetical protein